MRVAAALFVSCFAASCGDLDVRSLRTADAVPAALVGEWEGNWRSSATGRTGEVRVQVQEFGGEPLVHVDIDNPSVQPQVVDLVLTEDSIELRSGGEVVMSARLFQDRRLEGLFAVSGDRGTWSADWQRDLPPVGDLGGVWRGDLVPLGGDVVAIELELVQTVSSGQLRLDGLLAVPGAWPAPVAIEGSARFGAAGFELLARSVPGSAVPFTLSAAGAAGEDGVLRLGAGLLHVTGDDPQPFRDATFTLLRSRQ
ncbi:MAG: hypothetical protein WAT39_19485 [Planctomycetota bacterium]